MVFVTAYKFELDFLDRNPLSREVPDFNRRRLFPLVLPAVLLVWFLFAAKAIVVVVAVMV